jgi:hypothetical protein
MNAYWSKLGQLYSTEGIERHPKLLTHAANPTPVHLSKNVYRVFYSGRDKSNRSSISAVDIDIETSEIIDDLNYPLLAWDDGHPFLGTGVSIGNIYGVDDTLFVSFMAWRNPDRGHWYGEIGVAKLYADTTIDKSSVGLCLGLNEHDPISLSYPYVLNTGKCLEMWYGSTKAWDAGNLEMLHTIQHARSFDGGVSWKRQGQCIPYVVGQMQAFSRPSVLKVGSTLHMWYSFRGEGGAGYKIGHSIKQGGQPWVFSDVALEPSELGWDSDMVEYPCVFRHAGFVYMLYCGNHYGRDGFGIARMNLA